MEAADPKQEPGLKLLLTQLADDTRAFAKAEVEWIKAEAGSRANIAIPGLALVGAAIALCFAIIVGGLIGIILLLAPMIGVGWATSSVVFGAGMIALLLGKIGLSRLSQAFAIKDGR